MLIKLVPIIVILLSSLANCGTPYCEEKEELNFFLDAATHFISKAMSVNISCLDKENSTNYKPQDCADLYRRGYKKNGVYEIFPVNRLTTMKRLNVYCDMNDGGWTVIQRRGNFGRNEDYFNQNWGSYKKGFGDIERDFWLGNDYIFAITNQRPYSVYFELENKEQEKAYAHYDNFWIDDEFNKYTLHISGYRGTAGHSMNVHDTMKFSTPDQDNDKFDRGNCAAERKCGWWFNSCFSVNLNGMSKNEQYGIYWHMFGSNLTRAEIKIKPFDF